MSEFERDLAEHKRSLRFRLLFWWYRLTLKVRP